MKPMPDKVFVDTNILIYAYSVDESEKQAIVSRILSDHRKSAIFSIPRIFRTVWSSRIA